MISGTNETSRGTIIEGKESISLKELSKEKQGDGAV
jgi:hypothetical protein